MASVNKAIILGNLGADPELRYTPTGQAVTSLRIATTEKYKDKSGASQSRTDWHNVVCWGRLAEIAKDYLKKGSPVYVEGRIQYRSYDDKEGIKRYRTDIVAIGMQLLGGRPGGEQGQQEAQDMAEPAVPAEDDDLPF
ncbi:MAG: single-stranded DNA-binding protein [candidate division Zixibacteria bacterium RBG_16_53_22]|nr:MAG: single-stranded DNA-binding protein [candidate division Zixibacteria bacterium RBG_16_53_22]